MSILQKWNQVATSWIAGNAVVTVFGMFRHKLLVAADAANTGRSRDLLRPRGQHY